MVSASKGRDFYKILGVSRDASEAELKKAYRKMALKWHPDKNVNNKEQAEKMFKDIAEAYAVLTDKEKKQVYDRFGEEGLNAGMSSEDAKARTQFGGGGGAAFHMPAGFADDLFAQFFSQRSGGSHGSNGGRTFVFQQGGGQDPFGADPFGDQGDPFSSFGSGRSTKMPGGRGDPFSSFGGGRSTKIPGGYHQAQPQYQPHNPNEPEVEMLKQKEPIVRDVNVSLEDICKGITKKLKLTRKVYDPTTQRYQEKVKVVEIPVKAGMKEGTKFTFKAMGNEEPGYAAPDMVFVLKEKKNDKFTRQGSDVIYTAQITLKEALEGGSVSIPTLDGRNIRIPFSKMKRSEYTTTIPSQGLPNSKTGERGNIIVKFDVQFPAEETKRRRVAEAL
uniref:J domain-containing protein n=1 Tax=Mucochytrium quahogii TaxID=96639 RepID=A0A7S2SM42_9STRA|mmetsp:Transcript_35862/g.57168  ORF Transcript_35862/g.57168 Transcript_35862/m.57168 type:complete len:388 (-) Transcript_35862:1568-2731(-)